MRNHEKRIPAYDTYKTFFETCDGFNHRLNKKHWPFKRGGSGVAGENGAHNDCIMACILQNTFNAYHDINNTNYENLTFEKLCETLSDSIFQYSLTMNISK